jgi:WD40 repeat protein
MGTPRDFAPATALPDGRILICGGFNDVLGSLWNAEIFDPATETFVATKGLMNVPRELFQATSMADGKVLLTGGLNLHEHRTVSLTEIYDPAKEKFTVTGSMASDRFGHAACRLTDGRVFVVGGTSLVLGKNGHSKTLASAEVYDPESGSFGAGGSLVTARDRPTASLLPDGRVLVVGGQGANGAAVTTAEIWDPTTNTFASTPSPPSGVRMAHSAVTLPDDDVVVAGGWDAGKKATTATAELYDAPTGTFQSLAPLPFASHDAAAVVFADGVVLIAGGKCVTSSGESSSLSAGAVLRPSP